MYIRGRRQCLNDPISSISTVQRGGGGEWGMMGHGGGGGIQTNHFTGMRQLAPKLTDVTDLKLNS